MKHLWWILGVFLFILASEIAGNLVPKRYVHEWKSTQVQCPPCACPECVPPVPAVKEISQ